MYYNEAFFIMACCVFVYLVAELLGQIKILRAKTRHKEITLRYRRFKNNPSMIKTAQQRFFMFVETLRHELRLWSKEHCPLTCYRVRMNTYITFAADVVRRDNIATWFSRIGNGSFHNLLGPNKTLIVVGCTDDAFFAQDLHKFYYQKDDPYLRKPQYTELVFYLQHTHTKRYYTVSAETLRRAGARRAMRKINKILKHAGF